MIEGNFCAGWMKNYPQPYKTFQSTTEFLVLGFYSERKTDVVFALWLETSPG